MRTGRSLIGLLGWLLLAFAAAGVGAAASVQARSFYAELSQPGWAPPSSWFGPVWTVLYALIGVAAWQVWRTAGSVAAARGALGFFCLQLLLNALWSWLFFGWHLGATAFADIVVLWITIVCTLIAFWRVKPLAGALFIPYLAWVSFAAALNFAVWQMNPALLG
jgi:benzodiazapine receptor